MKQLFMLAILASTALTMSAQDTQTSNTKQTKKERTIALYGHVYDSFTKAGLPDTFITLMRSDSTVVDTLHVTNSGQWNSTKIDVYYRFQVPAKPQKYIIRAEHPDYETGYVDYEVKHVARNTYFDAPWHYLKHRQKNYEMEGGMLGTVNIRATKVKVVFRGDTIVYNADAFNLPEGSMLDALIRQLDGVELKDDGQILVNGKAIDELTLNGKDFFRGNNKILLENLPHYTVQNVQVYHKQTERSEYLGYDAEQKKYVMDVVLKREYAQGWLANVEVAGGTPFGEKDAKGNTLDNRYLARIFALRYTDNSRLSFFANTNNVNENRKPGSNGEWSPSNMPTGLLTTRQVGGDLLVDDGKKRWKENAGFTLRWTQSDNQTQTAAEHFLGNSSSTFSRNFNLANSKQFYLHASNRFELRKPFFLLWYTETQYSRTKHWNDASNMTTQADPAYWGNTIEALDSAFSLSLSPSKQTELINRSMSRSRSRTNRFYSGSYTEMEYKLPTGDIIGLTLNGNFTRQQDKQYDLRHIDYLQTGGGQNVRQNRYTSRPNNQYHYYFSPRYTISWLNGFKITANYRYLQERNENHNDAYSLDRLNGLYTETFGLLPSTRDSLLLCLDTQNAYEREHLRREHRVVITPHYRYDKNGKYAYIDAALEGYNVREQLRYISAATDTILRHNTYTFSPTITAFIATHNWSRQYQFYYNMEMKTPDLYSRVHVRNDENPLAVRMGNPNLKSPINHRMQMQVGRDWNETKTNFNIGGGLRFFLNAISQGYTYNPTTGVYTYMPMNVDGNWQTYFFTHFGRQLDKKGRFTLTNYAHGDYSRNVDFAAATTSSSSSGISSSLSESSSSAPYAEQTLSHVNNYYLEDRLTLNYRFNDLTLGTRLYGEYRHANNREHTIATINAFNYSYGLTANYNFKQETFARWLRGFSIATDIKMFSRRGYGDTSLNRDDLVWNASLSRTFTNPFGHTAGGSITARLEAFDLLHQLSTTTIVINGQGRTETIQTTLPRYLMLHLIYNFAKTPRQRK